MKKFIIIAVILFLIIFGASVYLNKVLLPQKFKALIVSGLAQQTGKEVSLKSLEFSIFRGLILRDLVISDNQQVILSTRQATCTIFIWPIFKKQIIIPSINLKSPYIFIERRQNNSFNLQDLFMPAKSSAKKSDFSVAVFKLTITGGNIVFQDDTLAVKFKKEIQNIKLTLQLGLPVKVKFNLSAELVSPVPVLFHAFGEYKILSQELVANLDFKHLLPLEFSAYYPDLGDLVSGLIDLEAQIGLKNKILQVDLAAQGDQLNFAKDNLKAKFNSSLQTKINYNLENKKLTFNGACDIRQADITGLEFLGQVKDLNGKFVFNQDSLVANSLKAQLLGVPFEISLGIKDFATKVLNISTDFDLSILPLIAKDKFNFSLINSASGKAALAIKIHPDNQGAWVVQGDLAVSSAGLKLDKVESPVEDISARLGFSQEGLSWSETKFKYQGVNYKSSGSVADFTSPRVKLKLFSDDLSASADFDLLGKQIKIAQLKGQYLDTQFSVSGDVDRTDPAKPRADLTGRINLELSNLNKLLEKVYPGIKAISPSGQLDTQFILSGPLGDFKNCYLQARMIGRDFYLYGFKATDLSLDFLQERRIAKIPAAYVTFYDGIIQASGALNLNAPDPAYQLELRASGVNLEKLKNDTSSREKNIGGIFLGEIKLVGAGNDLGKLDGIGHFAINRGRLGELNLLQGLGKLLLARDLGNIEFIGCTSDFLIKDKFVYTDNLKLSSHIVNLYGSIRIGFDSSLEGALDVEILSELIPLDGTFKDVTTAIIGKGGKFGVIKLSGTLKEPKYSFKTAVGNIIQGLAHILFKK